MIKFGKEYDIAAVVNHETWGEDFLDGARNPMSEVTEAVEPLTEPQETQPTREQFRRAAMSAVALNGDYITDEPGAESGYVTIFESANVQKFLLIRRRRTLKIGNKTFRTAFKTFDKAHVDSFKTVEA